MKHCLIVDDSSVIRKVAKRILARQDLAIAEAVSGEDGLEKCRYAMPDYIIVDCSLPDMLAEDFIKEVKEMVGEEPMPRISVCMVELDVSAIMRAKRAGAVGYCMKPFTRPQLIQRFRELSAA